MNGRPTAAAAGKIDVGGDLTANRLGFGAMRITGPGIWGDPPDRDRAKQAVRRAIELDVNFIDTADSYGPEVSERLIAEALYPYPEDLVIATKGGLVRPGPGRWVPDGRPEHLRRACEGSLARLRLDRIDLYQFHRPDPKVPIAESIGALAELKDEGKIWEMYQDEMSEPETTWSADVRSALSAQHGVKRIPREDGRHADADRSAPEPRPPGDAADPRWLPGMPGPGVRVGAPASVPDLRARGLLRLFATAARARPRLRRRAPDRPVVRARRGLALVLCRRNLRLRKPPTCRARSRG